MIKKLMCRHEYNYYHRSRYVPFFAVYEDDKWHFICKKCGKTSVIYGVTLMGIWDSIREKVKREEAMGIDNSEYDDMEFIMGTKVYSGKGAYYMKEKFKNYHQERAEMLHPW